MLEKLSRWLSCHEPLVRFMFRMAVAGMLVCVAAILLHLDMTVNGVAAQLEDLKNSIDEMRAALDGQGDDSSQMDFRSGPNRRL